MTTTVETVKACKKCGRVKSLSAYHTSPSTRDGHEGSCRACRRERNREREAAMRRAAGARERRIGSRAPADGAPPLDDAVRRAVAKGSLAGRHARLLRTPGGRRVYVVPAVLWAEARAATMRLAAAAGIAGGGE